MEEGAFVAWLKKDGDLVRSGEPLFSIEGDKAVQEIESIDSGILRIAVNGPKPGEAIRVGDVLGHLVSADEAGAVRAMPSANTAGSAAKSPSVQAPTATPASAAPPPASATASVQTGTTPTISPRALRVAAELGIDWTSIVGTGRTGRIRERDIRAAASRRVTGAEVRRDTAPSTATAGTGSVFLVTGGCGFIGTWVVRELLERGLAVVVLDAAGRPARWQRVIGSASEEISLVQGSLLDRELLKRVFVDRQVTHVIHLAALLTPACQADPWEGCRANVLGSVALFEQIRMSGNRIKGFSYASSVAVFGDEPDHNIGLASEVNQPPTFYGAFKKSVELIAEQYWRHFQIASVGIRPQVAYGPEREVGLTAGPSLAARAAARGEPYSIGYTGRVGYDYVEDIARAFVRGTLETPPGAQVIDLPGERVEVDCIIAAIAAAMPDCGTKLSANGPQIPAHTPPAPKLISALYPDWTTTPLAEGIRRTVDFYRSGPGKGMRAGK